VSGFRYKQFCPIARAAEVLGERWTLLIVRELLIEPQRFSDLMRRLPGVSSSVLSSRLRALEERGIAARRALPPPAASTVVELTELGHALRPVVVALATWGMRLMEPRRSGDHFEPSWLRIGLMVLIGPGPTPERCFALRVPDDQRDVVIHVAGGRAGTRLYEADDPSPRPERIDATVRAPAERLLAVLVGMAEPLAEHAAGRIEVTGDPDALRDLPRLFPAAGAFGAPAASAPDTVASTDEATTHPSAPPE